MKSKHEIMNKFDYMKALSFNFILSEKTNTELEHKNNVGKIDKAFYQNFAWQICGLKPKHAATLSKEMATRQTHQNASYNNNKIEDKTTKHENTFSNFITEYRTDYSGITPKRYTTKCYFQPVNVPIWYTESLFLKVGSTKRTYKEQVYFKNKLRPYSWSETFTTQVNAVPSKSYTTEKLLPVDDSGSHFMSLIPQQKKVY